MNIVSVYKSGGDYDIRYVVALANELIKYVKVPYKFYCLTDQPSEVAPYAIPVKLKQDWPGWWSKLELFDKEQIFNCSTDMVLYFDLDVLLLRNMQSLVNVCYQLNFPIMLRSSDKIGKANDWPSSSIMAWKGHMMVKVWLEAKIRGIEDVINKSNQNISRAGQRTDQGFIRTILNPRKFQDFLPKKHIVFKYPDYMKDQKVIDHAGILNWTGLPRFHQMGKTHPVRMLWEEQVHVTNQMT